MGQTNKVILLNIMIIPRLYSLLRARAYQPTAGLTFICSVTVVKKKTCGQFRDDMWWAGWVLQPLLCFLDQDCRYKSVATKTPQYAWLVWVRPAADRTRNYCVRGSDSASEPQKYKMKITILNSLKAGQDLQVNFVDKITWDKVLQLATYDWISLSTCSCKDSYTSISVL